MTTNDTLIRNGQVYDGTGSPAQRVDVRITNGVIAEIGPNLISRGEDFVESDGLFVAPGLIDLHVHVFSGIGLYSIDPYQAGLRTGVTSMLDTGTATTEFMRFGESVRMECRLPDGTPLFGAIDQRVVQA